MTATTRNVRNWFYNVPEGVAQVTGQSFAVVRQNGPVVEAATYPQFATADGDPMVWRTQKGAQVHADHVPSEGWVAVYQTKEAAANARA